MKEKPPIILARNVQPVLNRLRDVLLTVLLWAIYIYLMRDFFRFLGTIFYWLLFGVVTPELPAAFGVLQTVGYYLLIVIVNSCILLSWAIYNQIRFRGKDRRKPLDPIGVQDLAKLYNVQEQEVKEWQGLRIMTMYHDPYGNLVRIEPK